MQLGFVLPKFLEFGMIPAPLECTRQILIFFNRPDRVLKTIILSWRGQRRLPKPNFASEPKTRVFCACNALLARRHRRFARLRNQPIQPGGSRVHYLTFARGARAGVSAGCAPTFAAIVHGCMCIDAPSPRLALACGRVSERARASAHTAARGHLKNGRTDALHFSGFLRRDDDDGRRRGKKARKSRP